MTPASSSGPLLSLVSLSRMISPEIVTAPPGAEGILCEPLVADYRNESDSAVGKSEERLAPLTARVVPCQNRARFRIPSTTAPSAGLNDRRCAMTTIALASLSVAA